MDESEDDTLLSPAFEVDQTLVDRGQIISPQDGLQYLANVVLERRKCQEIVTAPTPNNASKQNIFATVPAAVVSAPESLLPTLEWQNYQVVDFSELRNEISRINSIKSNWTHSIKHPPIEGKHLNILWKEFLTNNEPLLSLVFTMKQIVLEYALDFIIGEIDEIPNGESINPIYGRWLFAILAALKLPLTPDACSSIRDLARTCGIVRSNLLPTDEDVLDKVAPLNLFICLTARYFGQMDIADK